MDFESPAQSENPQQQASNQWSYYQAKAIREHLYRSQRMILETSLLYRAGSMKPENKGRIETMLQKMAEEEAHYIKEKKEIEQEAKKFEKLRDLHRSKDLFFEFAEVLLQIAIVMSSISILATSYKVFFHPQFRHFRHFVGYKWLSDDFPLSFLSLILPYCLLCSWFLLIAMNFLYLFFVLVQYFPFLSKIVKKIHQSVNYLT
jgi:hypothetical protein